MGLLFDASQKPSSKNKAIFLRKHK